VRVEKLYGIIESCRFGIHDLSRTTLDSEFRLPRFNMPLELGIFLGARRYGTARQRRKAGLILDRDRYRFQIFCSDIAGQDIRAHKNEVRFALAAVRNWLQTHLSDARRYPGARTIEARYIAFQRQLPYMCRDLELDVRELTFLDYRQLVEGWRAANRVHDGRRIRESRT
jgi:hypothetical protein